MAAAARVLAGPLEVVVGVETVVVPCIGRAGTLLDVPVQEELRDLLLHRDVGAVVTAAHGNRAQEERRAAGAHRSDVR
jgi:hypothetical protein